MTHIAVTSAVSARSSLCPWYASATARAITPPASSSPIRPARRSSPSQSRTQARLPPVPAVPPPYPQPARRLLPDQREQRTQTEARWQTGRTTKLLGTTLMARHLTSYPGLCCTQDTLWLTDGIVTSSQHTHQIGHLTTEVPEVKGSGIRAHGTSLATRQISSAQHAGTSSRKPGRVATPIDHRELVTRKHAKDKAFTPTCKTAQG